MKSMKALVVIALVAMANSGFAVDQVYSPVANVTERWTNDAMWSIVGDGTRLFADQTMGLAYASQTFPITLVGCVKADSSASGGRYTGNYVNSAITHVSFDVMRVGLSSSARLRFTGKSGKLWYYSFGLPTQDSTWEHREIPMSYSENWKTSGGGTAEAFEADKAEISGLEVRIVSTGNSDQQVRIDNFKVLGPWEKGPMTTDEMPLYWLLENGLPMQSGQASLDADGDGFGNYGEYLAGTDPNNVNSKFSISIDVGFDGNPVLSWARENYRAYRVFKTTDITVSDSFVEEIGSIQALGSMNRMVVPSESSGNGFYRVKIEKQ